MPSTRAQHTSVSRCVCGRVTGARLVFFLLAGLESRGLREHEAPVPTIRLLVVEFGGVCGRLSASDSHLPGAGAEMSASVIW